MVTDNDKSPHHLAMRPKLAKGTTLWGAHREQGYPGLEEPKVLLEQSWARRLEDRREGVCFTGKYTYLYVYFRLPPLTKGGRRQDDPNLLKGGLQCRLTTFEADQKGLQRKTQSLRGNLTRV